MVRFPASGLPPLSGSNAQPGSSAIQKWANSPGIKTILNAFNIEPVKITGLTKQPGLQAPMAASLVQIQVMPLNKDQITALQALGLGGIEVAVLVEAHDQIADLKTKLKKIKNSVLNKKDHDAVLAALGFQITEESTVIADEHGGLLVLQRAFEDLQESLSETAED